MPRAVGKSLKLAEYLQKHTEELVPHEILKQLFWPEGVAERQYRQTVSLARRNYGMRIDFTEEGYIYCPNKQRTWTRFPVIEECITGLAEKKPNIIITVGEIIEATGADYTDVSKCITSLAGYKPDNYESVVNGIIYHPEGWQPCRR